MMKEKRVLVTGASGMVGNYAPQVFGECHLMLTDIEHAPYSLDIRDRHAVRQAVGDFKPEFVLHLGAATDVDRCEEEPEWAYKTNVSGTENVARACVEFDATLVYVSTAAVFSGDKNEPYSEDDVAKPANLYGRSKLEGEHYVSSVLRRYYIVRAGWMIGGGRKDKKFVGKIAQFINEGRQNLKAVDDKIGTPTYARDLLEGIKKLIDTDCYGTYHMGNSGFCTRYDIAVAITKILNRSDVSVLPVDSSQFTLSAPRGQSEALLNMKLDSMKIHRMRSWQDALRSYLLDELMPALQSQD